MCCRAVINAWRSRPFTECLRLFAPLPRQLAGDAFGLIYEDFLSNFAASEGRLRGEFFTPYSIVRLIVEIIEPVSRARMFDPFMRNMGVSRDVQTGAAAVRQEIFGPLLSVTPYDTDDEARRDRQQLDLRAFR